MNTQNNNDNQAAFCFLATQAGFCFLSKDSNQKRPSVELQLTDLTKSVRW
jgi:hypothetical protein